MLTVMKYEIEVADRFNLNLPSGARILSIQMQNDIPYIWALIDTNAKTEKRTFSAFSMNQPIESVESLTFVGAFQVLGMSLVFHLFEWSK